MPRIYKHLFNIEFNQNHLELATCTNEIRSRRTRKISWTHVNKNDSIVHVIYMKEKLKLIMKDIFFKNPHLLVTGPQWAPQHQSDLLRWTGGNLSSGYPPGYPGLWESPGPGPVPREGKWKGSSSHRERQTWSRRFSQREREHDRLLVTW